MSSYEQLLPPPESVAAVAVALGSRVNERCRISLLRPPNEPHSPTRLVVGIISREPTYSPELNCQPNRTAVAIAMIVVE